MRYPQLVVWEADGRLAAALRPLADRSDWVVREPRQVEAALKLLAKGGPNILILRTGRDLEREFTLVEAAGERCPEARVVVVLDPDQPRLQALAWNLGAACVLSAGEARERLFEVVTAMLGGSDDGPAGGR